MSDSESQVSPAPGAGERRVCGCGSIGVSNEASGQPRPRRGGAREGILTQRHEGTKKEGPDNSCVKLRPEDRLGASDYA